MSAPRSSSQKISKRVKWSLSRIGNTVLFRVLRYTRRLVLRILNNLLKSHWRLFRQDVLEWSLYEEEQ